MISFSFCNTSCVVRDFFINHMVSSSVPLCEILGKRALLYFRPDKSIVSEFDRQKCVFKPGVYKCVFVCVCLRVCLRICVYVICAGVCLSYHPLLVYLPLWNLRGLLQNVTGMISIRFLKTKYWHRLKSSRRYPSKRIYFLHLTYFLFFFFSYPLNISANPTFYGSVAILCNFLLPYVSSKSY